MGFASKTWFQYINPIATIRCSVAACNSLSVYCVDVINNNYN